MPTGPIASQEDQSIAKISAPTMHEQLEAIRNIPAADLQKVIDGCVAQVRRSTRSITHLLLPPILVVFSLSLASWVLKAITDWESAAATAGIEGQIYFCMGAITYLICSWELAKDSVSRISCANAILVRHGCTPIHAQESENPLFRWLYSDASGKSIVTELAPKIAQQEKITMIIEMASLAGLLFMATQVAFSGISALLPFLSLLPLAILFIREPLIRTMVGASFHH